MNDTWKKDREGRKRGRGGRKREEKNISEDRPWPLQTDSFGNPAHM